MRFDEILDILKISGGSEGQGRASKASKATYVVCMRLLYCFIVLLRLFSWAFSQGLLEENNDDRR